MKLKDLLIKMTNVASAEELINFSASMTSIYQFNSLDVKNYPACVISPTGNLEVVEGFETFNITVFVFDRLLDDSSNDIDIQSFAYEQIKALLKRFRTIENIVDIDSNYSIVPFTETERMSDKIMGAYATVKMTATGIDEC